MSSDRAAGNIGLPVKRFRLMTDYPHNAVWLISNASALAELFPKGRSGLNVTPAGDRGSPLSRWAGGPAGTEVTLSLTDGSTRKLTLAAYF